MQSNCNYANQNYVQQSNAKNYVDFYNPYFQNHYHKNNLVSFEYFLRVQGSNGSHTSSIESIGSDTNKSNDVTTISDN